jgi:hypothetical protein
MERHKDASDHNGVRQLESVKPRSRRSSEAFKKLIVLTNIGILPALLTGVGVHNAMGINSPSQSGSTISGIKRDTEKQDLFHNHAHLDIFVNAHVISIPPEIGILDHKCLYWLHTHDETGVIHIESPVKREFTLGQFFDVLKGNLNNSKSFDDILGGKLVPTVYVNGTKVLGNVNYKDIKPNAYDEIEIIYGTPPKFIPSKYSFEEGL